MKHVTIPAQWLQELIALCGPEDHELRERVMKSAAPAPADPLATATGLPAQEHTPDSFREWFANNYPADTIIVDPDWHAKSIFRMAQAHARLAAPQAQEAADVAKQDQEPHS